MEKRSPKAESQLDDGQDKPVAADAEKRRGPKWIKRRRWPENDVETEGKKAEDEDLCKDIAVEGGRKGGAARSPAARAARPRRPSARTAERPGLV